MKRSSTRLAALIAVAIPVTFGQSAQAGEEGFYVGIMGGPTVLQNSTLSGEVGSTSADAITLDENAIVGASIGYDYGAWRAEADFTYQHYDVDQIRDNVTGFADAAGDIDMYGLAINGYYDFHSSDLPVVPYIGLGLGAFYADAQDIQQAGRSKLSESAVAPLVQAMLGASYSLTDNISLTGGYRVQWVGVLGGSHTKSNGTTTNADVDPILMHSINVGLRFNF